MCCPVIGLDIPILNRSEYIMKNNYGMIHIFNVPDANEFLSGMYVNLIIHVLFTFNQSVPKFTYESCISPSNVIIL